MVNVGNGAFYAPPGSIVLNAYWQLVYRVDSIDDGWITVTGIPDHVFNSPQWRGDRTMFRTRTHATCLDRRDTILSFPVDGPQTLVRAR